MNDLLLEKWNSEIVVGDRKANVPNLLGFKHTIEAVSMLRRHINMNSRIAIHGDVDVDGIGSTYIIKSFLKSLGATNVLCLINKEKVHGVQEKHVGYFNNFNNCDLLIVLDSSTNEIDILKKFNCDVLVVDHHEILHKELYVKSEYECVIINNMIDNKNSNEINEWLKQNNPNTSETIADYIADERMSGGLVLYELLRIYCEAYKTGNILENLMLYQWVGVTLFSDSVLLVSDRNQWYIENTVHSMYVERTLQIMMTELNKYKATLDKSFIIYTLVPTINKAIRAGSSSEALDITLNRPQDITKLLVYKEMQKKALELCISETAIYKDDYIIKNITSTGVSKNYCGVIAAHLCGENNKNAVVFIMNGDIAEGSFRGRRSDVNYRKFFEDYNNEIYAQGHKPAFGFKAKLHELEEIMSKISTIEPKKSSYYLTAGGVPNEIKGKYHITSMDNFKKLGFFWRLAVANSKLSSDEQLEIIASSSDAILEKCHDKLYVYNIMGVSCKAFEPITSKFISIYSEYSKTIEVYVKNLNI